MPIIIKGDRIYVADSIASGLDSRGLTILPDARFDSPPDDVELVIWRDGERRPENAVGESMSEPGRFRRFKHRHEMEPMGFRDTGLSYGDGTLVYPSGA